MRAWERIAEESTTSYGIFTARVDLLRSPRNQEVLRRVVLTAPDWVNVICRTTTGTYLMVRQIRHGLGSPTWEIPAGSVDGGEAPEQAAAREVLEETGYQPRRLVKIGQVHPNPAFQSNTCHLYFADGCTRVREPQLDPGEDLELAEWSWEDLRDGPRSGRITHALVINALYFFDRPEHWDETSSASSE